jgi:hypothetical protein
MNRLVEDLFWAADVTTDPLLLKTFSFISINYTAFIDFKSNVYNLKEIEKKLETNAAVNQKVSRKVKINLGISSEPIYSKEIGKYWKSRLFDVEDVIGQEDTIVTPKKVKVMTWSYFINTLFKFRHDINLKNKILTTNTTIKREFKNKENIYPGANMYCPRY